MTRADPQAECELAQGERKPERRGALTRHTSVHDFREFYWLKSELQDFCREHGLSCAGGKCEIADRIEAFLAGAVRTVRAERDEPRRIDSEEARRFNALTAPQFTMKTRIPRGFRCTQELRKFFARNVDPEFRFTVTLQNYIKEHPGISFEELAAYWRRESAARKDGSFRPSVAPQFEYNQFTRDFYADPANRGKPRQDCLAAWRRVRDTRGDNKYRPGPPRTKR
ncbi:MAG: cytoplasmic protein [Myxococcaceae bacterium]|nr:cytoplasmic protein [Myxococcaceae bacterium]